jgi:hypothetical protein
MADIGSLGGLGGPMIAGMIGAFAGFIVLFIILIIALYIYQSLAFVAISKKAGLTMPGLSWIPGVGPTIQAYRISKMHWWPWLLLIGCFIPILNFVCIIVFAVFSFMWVWKMFIAVKRPGWWALIPLGSMIPFLGILFGIAYMVLIGIAAWGKN